MRTIRFVHAADLHLDVPFPDLSQKMPEPLALRLRDATFRTLDQLVALCERERPDFLILVGDLAESGSVRAQLALREACAALNQMTRTGIPVFIACGDPAITAEDSPVPWPPNVTLFHDDPQAIPLPGPDGQPLALVHGISRACMAEHALRFFHRTEAPCLQVGVLPCAHNEGTDVAHASSFIDTGLDYWALGGRHERAELCARPLVVHPGESQGLSRETPGEKGCVLVTAESGEDGCLLSTRFHPLAPVVWHNVEINLDGASGPIPEEKAAESADPPESDPLATTKNALRAAIRRLAQRNTFCELLVLSLRLTLSPALMASLYREESRQKILEALREDEESAVGEKGCRVWIADLELQAPPRPPAAQAREDLIGELVRRTASCRTSEAEKQSLYSQALASFPAPAIIPSLTTAEDLLDDAERLCVALLQATSSPDFMPPSAPQFVENQ